MNTNRATFFLSGYRWILTGIIIGLIFYLFFGNIIPYLFEEEPVERSLLYGVIYWSFFGIGFIGLTKVAMEIGYTGKKWIIQGLLWGLSMSLILNLAVPYFGGEEITMSRTLIGLIVFLIGGLGYGYVMKLYFNEQESKSEVSR